MPLVVWGKCRWAPEHPDWVVFPLTLQRSLLWLQREPRHWKLRCSSALNVHQKHLHTKFHSLYTWTHVFWTCVFHLKTRRLKNASGSLEGERGGKGWRMQLFQHQDPWASPAARSSISFFLKHSFLCCIIFTQAPSYTQAAAQAWQQPHLRQIVQWWVKSTIKPQQLLVLYFAPWQNKCIHWPGRWDQQ